MINFCDCKGFDRMVSHYTSSQCFNLLIALTLPSTVDICTAWITTENSRLVMDIQVTVSCTSLYNSTNGFLKALRYSFLWNRNLQPEPKSRAS